MDPDFKLDNPPLVRQHDAAAPEPNNPASGKGAKPKSKRWLVALLAVVIVLVLGGLAFALHHKSTKATVKPKVAAAKVIKAKAPAPKAPPIPSTSYTASDFNTAFSYPSSWTVVDSGTAPLTITSPEENLVADSGKSVPAQVVVTLARQGTIPPAFSSQSVAVMTSSKINYSAPAAGQAADTYISFVQYPSTTVVGGLDGIYITGNYGYQKFQSIPASNISSIDPIVYASFYSCATSACPIASRQPLTIASSDWKDTSFSAPLMLIFKSFTFS